jgi:hypothetical protein
MAWECSETDKETELSPEQGLASLVAYLRCLDVGLGRLAHTFRYSDTLLA